MTEPDDKKKTYKTANYEANREYARARYRANKYKIRAKYADKKLQILEEKANAFREKLKIEKEKENSET